jgi:hypothetical protein
MFILQPVPEHSTKGGSGVGGSGFRLCRRDQPRKAGPRTRSLSNQHLKLVAFTGP